MSPTVFSQIAALTEPRRTSWTGRFRGEFAGVEPGMVDRMFEFVFILSDPGFAPGNGTGRRQTVPFPGRDRPDRSPCRSRPVSGNVFQLRGPASGASEWERFGIGRDCGAAPAGRVGRGRRSSAVLSLPSAFLSRLLNASPEFLISAASMTPS